MPPYQIPLQPIITRLKDRILALEKPLTDLDEKFASIVNYQGRREPWTPEMTRAKDAFKNAQARGNSAFKAVVDHGNQDNPDYYQMAKHAVIWGESKAEESAGRAAFMTKYEDAYQTIGKLGTHIDRAKNCEGEARDALAEAEVDMKKLEATRDH